MFANFGHSGQECYGTALRVLSTPRHDDQPEVHWSRTALTPSRLSLAESVAASLARHCSTSSACNGCHWLMPCVGFRGGFYDCVKIAACINGPERCGPPLPSSLPAVATLAETLPIRKRSIPLSPRAPRKMQSAFQLEAASTRISRGSPSGVLVETANPALCNFCVVAVIIRCN